MTSYKILIAKRGPFKALIALALVGIMLLVASGDLLANHCDQDCDSHSHTPGHDCTDCARCLPGMQMIVNSGADLSAITGTLSWTAHAASLRGESSHIASIDHPPQNLQ
jgi:hypothetical protein